MFIEERKRNLEESQYIEVLDFLLTYVRSTFNSTQEKSPMTDFRLHLLLFCLTTIGAMSISFYWFFHPIENFSDIINAIHTESDEVDEYIWIIYLTITISFLFVLCLFVVEIIGNSLMRLRWKK